MADRAGGAGRGSGPVHRPAAIRDGTGGWLRWVGGVDEGLLAKVPTERARYTALGGVVVGTATIAAFSMAMALSAVLGGFTPLIVPVALLWGAFVLNLDRWLVSSSSGSQWRRRAVVLLPRLALAVFFGVVIAEPLVLRAFQTAIEQEVRTERQQELDDLTGALLRCNPEPTDTTPPPADCAQHHISFESTPLGTARELAAAEADAERLQAGLDTDAQEQQRLDTLARNECAGTAGPGLTGQVGRGPECIRLETQADDFRRSHPVDGRYAELAALRERISGLQAGVGTARADYQAVLADEVAKRVDERRGHHGPIGLLERFQTLHDLIGVNAFLAAATWCIRLLFIAIDCLPVLVKLFGGTTSYDRLVDERLASAVRIDREVIRADEVDITSGLDVRQHAAVTMAQRRRAEIDFTAREHEAGIDARRDRAVDVLTEQLTSHRSTGRGQAGPQRPRHRPIHDDDTVSFHRIR